MIDREIVIKGLEIHTKPNSRCNGCPYPNNGLCGDQLYHDALALLKEQEPVKVVVDGEDFYMCNNCGMVVGWVELDHGEIVEMKSKFCPECGLAVKWDG